MDFRPGLHGEITEKRPGEEPSDPEEKRFKNCFEPPARILEMKPVSWVSLHIPLASGGVNKCGGPLRHRADPRRADRTSAAVGCRAVLGAGYLPGQALGSRELRGRC